MGGGQSGVRKQRSSSVPERGGVRDELCVQVFSVGFNPSKRRVCTGILFAWRLLHWGLVSLFVECGRVKLCAAVSGRLLVDRGVCITGSKQRSLQLS